MGKLIKPPEGTSEFEREQNRIERMSSKLTPEQVEELQKLIGSVSMANVTLGEALERNLRWSHPIKKIKTKRLINDAKKSVESLDAITPNSLLLLLETSPIGVEQKYQNEMKRRTATQEARLSMSARSAPDLVQLSSETDSGLVLDQPIPEL